MLPISPNAHRRNAPCHVPRDPRQFSTASSGFPVSDAQSKKQIVVREPLRRGPECPRINSSIAMLDNGLLRLPLKTNSPLRASPANSFTPCSASGTRNGRPTLVRLFGMFQDSPSRSISAHVAPIVSRVRTAVRSVKIALLPKIGGKCRNISNENSRQVFSRSIAAGEGGKADLSRLPG